MKYKYNVRMREKYNYATAAKGTPHKVPPAKSTPKVPPTKYRCTANPIERKYGPIRVPRSTPWVPPPKSTP